MSSVASAQTLLNFSNGSSTLDDGGVGNITYTSIAPGIDLVVTADSNYTARVPDNNGTKNGDDYQIHLDANNQGTVFCFNFVQTGTTTPTSIDSFYISILDLDAGGEIVELLPGPQVDVTYRTDTQMNNIGINTDGNFQLGGKTGGSVTDPTNSENLSNAQERVAANLLYSGGVTEFKMKYATIGTASGRNFFGDSHASIFDNGTTTTQTLDAVPEPSSVALLGLGGLGLMLRRRK